MTKIKFCGLSRSEDIQAACELGADYIGFVFAKKSRRYITPEKAGELKKMLIPGIKAAGVFVDENPETVAELLDEGIIDIAQLHGKEDEGYISELRKLTSAPIIQAFLIESREDIKRAELSSADYVLLDSGAGTGEVFDWEYIDEINRPYFLAGGLTPDNAGEAVRRLRPFAVDVSSGIETDGVKDKGKMASFADAVRKER